MKGLRWKRSFMMMPIGRLALPGMEALPLEVVRIINGFGISASRRGGEAFGEVEEFGAFFQAIDEARGDGGQACLGSDEGAG